MPTSVKFVRPCIPTTAKAIPLGDSWLYEPKLDGYFPCLQPVQASEDGAKLFEVAERHGLEGIVSAYRSGPSCDWVKTKTVASRTANRDRWRAFQRERWR